MATPGSTLDLETELAMPFSTSEWINRGKYYPGHADAPLHVHGALLKRTCIPDVHLARFPSAGLTVNEFRVPLPRQSFSLEATKSGHWFSNEPPTCGIDVLLSRDVPPSSILDTIWETIGQKWLDGAQSITDPRFNNARDRFPLWAISFWKRMHNVIMWQADWKERWSWLQGQSQIVQASHSDSETVAAAH